MKFIDLYNSDKNIGVNCHNLLVSNDCLWGRGQKFVFVNTPGQPGSQHQLSSNNPDNSNTPNSNAERKFVDFYQLLQRLHNEKKLEEKNIVPLLEIFQKAPDSEKEDIFRAYISKGIGKGPKEGTPEKQKLDEIEAKLKGQAPETAAKPAGAEKQRVNGIKKIQEDIHAKVQNLLGELDEKIAIAQQDSEKNKKILNTLQRIHKNLSTISKITSTNQKEMVATLDQLKKRKIITDDQEEEILAIDGSYAHFEKEWRALIEPFRGNREMEAQLKKIHDLKVQRARHVEDFQKAVREIGETLQEAAENINTQVRQETALRRWSKDFGFRLKEGQELRVKRFRSIVQKDASGNITNSRLEPVTSKMVIKRVFFEDISTEDENGKSITIPSNIPMLEIGYQDDFNPPEGWEISPIDKKNAIGDTGIMDSTQGTITQSALNFIKAFDWQSGSEIYDKDIDQNLDEDAKMALEVENASNLLKNRATTGEVRVNYPQIEVGRVFEYRETFMPSRPKGYGVSGFGVGMYNEPLPYSVAGPKKVKIVNITREKDPFYQDNKDLKRMSQKKDAMETFVELDEPIMVPATHDPERFTMVPRKKLPLGEFLRWCRRVNAVPPMSLNELREALQTEKTQRDQKYQAAGRNPEFYPPIAAEAGEMLYYDTEPPKKFVIKEVDKDGKIFLDNGSYYTPATFLEWVQENEVEKMTPEIEAKKRTAHIKDDEERARAEALAKAQEEEAAKAREEQGKDKDQQDKLDGSETVEGTNGSYLKQLWNQTYWLSGGSLYMMGEQIVDYIKNQLTRMEKERVGAVGEAVLSPISSQLGGIMKSLKQSGETEDVNRYADVYRQYGPNDLYDRLSVTTSKNELKAIFTVLAEKGAIRWEDPLLWDAMTRIAQQVDATIVVNQYDEDLFRRVIDEVYGWGGQSYAGWKSQNVSAYNSTKSNWQSEGLRLENDPQGINGRLQHLMHLHIQGEYVDPAIFEGLLHFAIDVGKMYFQDKLYFLILGMGVESPSRGGYKGLTLLTQRRVSEMEASFISKFPVIEYFVDTFPDIDENGKPIMDKNGKQKESKFNQNHAKYLINRFVLLKGKKRLEDLTPKEFAPGGEFIEFVHREINLNERVRKRAADKASNDYSNKDHDDLPYIVPFADENQINRVALAMGVSTPVSPAGLRNSLSGLNHYTMIYMDKFLENVGRDAEQANKFLDHFQNTIRSFVRLDAIVDDRYEHGNTNYQHMNTDGLKRGGADSDPNRPAFVHVQELNAFITALIETMRKHYTGPNPEIFAELEALWINVNKKYETNQINERTIQKGDVEKFGLKFGSALKILNDNIGNTGVAKILAEVQDRAPIKGITGVKAGKKKEGEPEDPYAAKY